jgi:membrane fusion protein (multidrug efflux system)
MTMESGLEPQLALTAFNAKPWGPIRRPLVQQIAIAGRLVVALVAAGWLLIGSRGSPTPPAPPPTPVGVTVIKEEPVTLTAELPGRTAAYETSEVRPQVDGIIRARLFTEGEYVREGQDWKIELPGQ